MLIPEPVSAYSNNSFNSSILSVFFSSSDPSPPTLSPNVRTYNIHFSILNPQHTFLD